jgi:thymidylate kinase
MIITFEGINGTGKTTAAKYVADKLGVELVRFPQPGLIREALLNPDLDRWAKFYLYLADMSDWYANHDRQQTYILDRSYISTLVYQSREGIPPNFITKAVENAGIYIDGIIHLTASPKLAKARRDADVTKDGGNPGGYAERDAMYYAKLQKDYKNTVAKEVVEGRACHPWGWENCVSIATDELNIEELCEECYIITKGMNGV